MADNAPNLICYYLPCYNNIRSRKFPSVFKANKLIGSILVYI